MIIDSRIGGLGDVWMRLVALYSLAQQRPAERHRLLLNPVLLPLAQKLFSDRFDVASEGTGDVIYTHLGLRHLGGGLLRGRRYVFPFYWLLREKRARASLRDWANDCLIGAACLTRRLMLPGRDLVNCYQGYMELQALVPFRDVLPEAFDAQARHDLSELGRRLRTGISDAVNDTVVVFPSGTAHQVMPPDWARAHLSHAVFAFHAGDCYAEDFAVRGLRIKRFHTPEQMLALGAGARRIFATDSFPSHLWQVFAHRVVLLLTQQPRTRIVHPGFPSAQVVVSRAPCSPCRNRDRGHHARCDAGYAECVTWASSEYVASFKSRLA